MERARAESEDLEAANALLVQALELSPAAAPIWHQRGELYQQHKQLKQAVEYLQQARTMDPDNRQYRLDLSRAKEQQDVQQLEQQGMVQPEPEPEPKPDPEPVREQRVTEKEPPVATTPLPGPAPERAPTPDDRKPTDMYVALPTPPPQPARAAARSAAAQLTKRRTAVLADPNPLAEVNIPATELELPAVCPSHRDDQLLTEILWDTGAELVDDQGQAASMFEDAFTTVLASDGARSEQSMLETIIAPTPDPTEEPAPSSSASFDELETVREAPAEYKKKLAAMLRQARDEEGEEIDDSTRQRLAQLLKTMELGTAELISVEDAPQPPPPPVPAEPPPGQLSLRAQALMLMLERDQASTVMRIFFGPHAGRPKVSAPERALVLCSALVAMARQVLTQVPQTEGEIGAQLEQLRQLLDPSPQISPTSSRGG